MLASRSLLGALGARASVRWLSAARLARQADDARLTGPDAPPKPAPSAPHKAPSSKPSEAVAAAPSASNVLGDMSGLAWRPLEGNSTAMPADLTGEYRFSISAQMLEPYKDNTLLMDIVTFRNASQMDINTARIQKAIRKFQQAPGDTGSPDVQIAVLSEKIGYMTQHLRTHRKDVHNRRGLQAMLSKRRKLMLYLKRTSLSRYAHVVAELGLRA